MAEASVSVSQDQFSCPICLDVMKDPVAIPCGHSFCMDCITDCWDHEDQKGVYSCPQCRQTFTPRPVTGKNMILAEMVERFKKTVVSSDSSSQLYAGPGDVECDVCIGRKCKAVKSCLVCLTSYCETHFRAHNSLNPGKKHKVIDAAGKLEDLICSHHDKLLEVFCRTDQTCICLMCTLDEHKGHDTVSAAAERTEKQKQLKERQRNTHQAIQERQKHLQEITEAMKSLKTSAQAAVEDSERIFAEMIRSVENRRSEVTKLIRDQEKAEVIRAEELIEKLEWEIGQLRKTESELEQLSQTEDHTNFLQIFQRSLTDGALEDSSTDTSVNSGVTFEEMKKTVSQLKDKLDDFLKDDVCSISDRGKVLSLFGPRQPLTREDFLRYVHQLNLDPNTAQPRLYLTSGNKEVTWKATRQSYPNNPERFDGWQQVLCKESVTGRCYWEVEWSESKYKTHVSIALSHKEISRKGCDRQIRFGHNEDSWCLTCSSSSCTFKHNGVETVLRTAPSNRIGVYVDHSAGILSFYSITNDTMTLLHKLQTTFSKPLYPGFWLETGSKLKLCF